MVVVDQGIQASRLLLSVVVVVVLFVVVTVLYRMIHGTHGVGRGIRVTLPALNPKRADSQQQRTRCACETKNIESRLRIGWRWGANPPVLCRYSILSQALLRTDGV